MAANGQGGSPEHRGVLTDLTLCIGCRSCELACNQVQKLPEPEVPFSDITVYERERRTSAGAYTVVNKYTGSNGSGEVYRKVQCMHCEEPACVSVCPVAAMVKTPEGPVLWDEKVCMGCRYCMMACPFNIPAYEYSEPFTPRVRKCVMCYERVFVEGAKAPGCVEACPTGALTFGMRDELVEIAQKRIVDNPGKYVNRIYGEREAGGTSWMYLSPLPFEEVGFPDVGDTPMGELTWDFLTAVPIVLILWPLALTGVNRFAQRRQRIAEEQVHGRPESVED